MNFKIYIAGPEVFLSNAREVLNAKAALARAYGFTPICPGDLEIPESDNRGHAINAIDEQMMDSADGIIANLTPFRGIACDTGTAYEVGYMCAQGKKAYGYTNVAADHFARARDFYSGSVVEDADGHLRGPDGLSLENFGMVDNLMLQGGIERRGGQVFVHTARSDARYTDLTAYEQCLEALARRLADDVANRDELIRPEDLDSSNDG